MSGELKVTFTRFTRISNALRARPDLRGVDARRCHRGASGGVYSASDRWARVTAVRSSARQAAIC